MMKAILLLVVVAIIASVYVDAKEYQDFYVPAVDEELVDYVNSQDCGWKAGVTPFLTDKSLGQIKRLLGFKRNPEARKHVPVKNAIMANLPQSYNASAAYPQCSTIGTIYNQAECSSSWVFGAVESASDRICIHSNGTLNVTLSFMDEVCCGPDEGCVGGDPLDAWNYMIDTGIVTEQCYPYTIPTCAPEDQPCAKSVNTPDCAAKCTNGDSFGKYKHYFSKSYLVSDNVQAIMTDIYTNGPVEACFEVYSDFVHYKSGVYKYTKGEDLGGTCVKIVGWGIENGTPYWLCNNSWTTTWGDNGTFKIVRGQDECGIEEDITGGIPRL